MNSERSGSERAVSHVRDVLLHDALATAAEFEHFIDCVIKGELPPGLTVELDLDARADAFRTEAT